MLLIDPASGLILDANPAACAYYGHTAEELREMCIWQLEEGSREQMAQALAKAILDHKLSYSGRHRLRSGELREVEIRAGLVETIEGQVLYCVIHDVTERTRAEENLRHAKESAESLNSNWKMRLLKQTNWQSKRSWPTNPKAGFWLP